jgi:hypothetical protein
LYGALFAYVSGLFDVCDVFVVFGEHEVGLVFAVGLGSPVGWLCGGWIYIVLLGHGLTIVVMHPLGIVIPIVMWLWLRVVMSV